MTEFNINTSGKMIVESFHSQVTARTFLITGPSKNSIGAETALSLAHGSPSSIILLGRDLAKITPTISSISALNHSIRIKYIPVDLSSLSSVRSAAKTIIDDSTIPKIDVMINNAAVMAAPYSLTEDGWESHFQVNHLSHFLLTNLLLPKLLASSPTSPSTSWARIVNVSSAGHLISNIRYTDIDFGKGATYVPWLAYGQSKTANVLFTTELNRRVKQGGLSERVRAFAATPGAVDGGLQQYVTPEMREEGLKAWREMGKEIPVRKSLQQGCATILRAALDPCLSELEQRLVYLADCQLTDDPAELAAFAVDEENARKCWALSEEMVGEKFEW